MPSSAGSHLKPMANVGIATSILASILFCATVIGSAGP